LFTTLGSVTVARTRIVAAHVAHRSASKPNVLRRRATSRGACCLDAASSSRTASGTESAVLAPHAKRLRAVVPKPPGVVHAHDLPASGSGTAKRDAATPASMQPQTPKRASPGPVPPRAERTSAPGDAAAPFSPHTFCSPPLAAAPAGPAVMPAACCAVAAAAGDVVITDFGISVRHKGRLLGGLLLATSPRIDWAKLIRRTFGIDALRCAHCAGRLRLLAAIPEKATARKILEHLGLPADPTSPRSRTRDPADPASWMDGAAEERAATRPPPVTRPDAGTRRTCGRAARRRPVSTSSI
jgi:hypothetical protein